MSYTEDQLKNFLQELWERYNNLSEEEKNINVASEQIMSTKRNVGFFADDSEHEVGDDKFDVITNIIYIVRTHPVLRSLVKDNEVELYTALLFSVANETIWKWEQLFLDYWKTKDDEFAIPLEDDPVCQTEWKLPSKQGEPVVTVFGDIVDQAGRVHSLTVTNYTDMREAYIRILYAVACYDNITMSMSNGVNLNPHGKSTYGISSHAKRTSQRKKATASKKTTAKKEITENDTPASNEVPKPAKPKTPVKQSNTPKATHCELFSDLRNLPANTVFTMPINAASLRKNLSNTVLTLYGYTLAPDGTKITEDHDTVYYHDSRHGYRQLLDTLANMDIKLSEYKTPLPKEMLLKGIKKIANSGHPYYDRLEWIEGQ